jgi:hypothetical protein
MEEGDVIPECPDEKNSVATELNIGRHSKEELLPPRWVLVNPILDFTEIIERLRSSKPLVYRVVSASSRRFFPSDKAPIS